jgi:GH18 family chitinase
MKAKNAKTDRSYTHMHSAFDDIGPKTWMPVVNNSIEQWENFKKTLNMKRILSLGDWAYSIDSATHNINREAIINNRNTFAANLARFGQDEGIDVIDIDLEYPGAADVMVGVQPLGKTYLKFLNVKKKALGKDKSVSLSTSVLPVPHSIPSRSNRCFHRSHRLHDLRSPCQCDSDNPNTYDMCPEKCNRGYNK